MDATIALFTFGITVVALVALGCPVQGKVDRDGPAEGAHPRDARPHPRPGAGSRNPPIKILLLAANPRDTERLRLDEEARAIRERLRTSPYGERFVIEQEWAVRASDLQAHLLRHQPHIVHISGHGSPIGETVLGTQSGQSTAVSSAALKRLFAALKGDIRCVVLNACFSEVQARAIVEVIGCVVGMGAAITDEAAISFAAGFYQALGFGRDIRTAFELGCGEIGLENLKGEDTPKLIMAHGAVESTLFGARSVGAHSL
jgi:hypothetical protein